MTHSDDLVSICKVYDTIEAELIKGQLESEGIPCFLKADNAGGVLSYLTNSEGIEVIVNKEDVEKATSIL